MDNNSDRRQLELSEDDLERIARRSSELVWEHFTLEVGKVTIKSALYVFGAAILALIAWLGIAKEIKF